VAAEGVTLKIDGISFAASIIVVIQIAQTVASTLKDYYEAARDARSDIQQLYHSVNSLEAILSCIQDLKIRREDLLVSSALLDNASGPLQQSYLELDSIRVKLGTSPKYGKKFSRTVHLLTWPFQKKDVERAVAVIERATNLL
jgi:hypothetical protein